MRVLIVEDEVLVAAELEWMVEEFGHRPVGSAVSSDEALELAARFSPDMAFVDVCLADGPTGVDAARGLVARGVRVMFMTANPKRLPDDLAGAAGVIAKPYAPGAVRKALEQAAAALDGGGREATSGQTAGEGGTAASA